MWGLLTQPPGYTGQSVKLPPNPPGMPPKPPVEDALPGDPPIGVMFSGFSAFGSRAESWQAGPKLVKHTQKYKVAR